MDPIQQDTVPWDVLRYVANRVANGEQSTLGKFLDQAGMQSGDLARWGGISGIKDLLDNIQMHSREIMLNAHPDLHNDAPMSHLDTSRFYEFIKSAPNKTLQGLRESMGPVMGSSFGSMADRANVASGVGDIASRWAALALSSGPSDDPLASYARFIMNQQSSPAPQTQL